MDGKMTARFLKDNKHVFLEALLIAIFVFTTGLMIGVFLETLRQSNIQELYSRSEFELLDLRVQNEILDFPDFTCEDAVRENIKFGDRIFEEALLLQDLESSQTLTEALKQQHRKYDLLRTLLWVNSIKIKNRCPGSFQTVVYIYNYKPSLDEKAQQKIFSKSLIELKEKAGDKVILIPIAGNMDLISTGILMEKYNAGNLPVILIDEVPRAHEIDDLPKLESFII